MTVEIGKLDRLTMVIGERGTGKSTLAKIDARAFQDETGGYVIGHSPNGQIGDDDDIRLHSSIEKLSSDIREKPEMMHIVTKGSPEAVLAHAENMARAIRKRAVEDRLIRFKDDRPAPPGTMARPVLCIVDEGVHMKSVQGKRTPQEFEEMLVGARHKHMAMTFLLQEPTSRTWKLSSQANRFRVFRYTHQWGNNALEAGGIPKELLSKVKTLPNFKYVAWDKQDPTGGEIRTLPKP